ncbi:hypothetical protein [Streptomyces sp. NPDC051684]|uniref:hypothetical protein n=1 Tax=Streptomyces sp. NPDC051684 TaxID=3365670 RepID=UPI00378DEC90
MGHEEFEQPVLGGGISTAVPPRVAVRVSATSAMSPTRTSPASNPSDRGSASGGTAASRSQTQRRIRALMRIWISVASVGTTM